MVQSIRNLQLVPVVTLPIGIAIASTSKLEKNKEGFALPDNRHLHSFGENVNLKLKPSSFKVDERRIPANNTLIPTDITYPAIAVERNLSEVELKAVCTIRRKPRPDINEQILDQLDVVADQLGLANIKLQLVSEDIDPKTPSGKRSKVATLQDWAGKASVVADKVQYLAKFIIPRKFGRPGAMTITNYHQNEFFLESVALESAEGSSLYFLCNSWVQPVRHSGSPAERVFFTNQVYLPSATPAGLKDLREKELKALRGDGKGERKAWERIYDYDTYKDLGDPDRGKHLARRVLGNTMDRPYPRRCRTGRPPTRSDPDSESRLEAGGKVYVPRDECFDPIKEATFIESCMKGLTHKLAPALIARLTDTIPEFNSFGDIDKLYSQIDRMPFQSPVGLRPFLQELPFPDIMRRLPFLGETTIHYPVPDLISKDKFAWMRDEEFGRQVLAGQNPSTIELLKVFPPISSLDEELFGCRLSAIKAEHIECYLGGLTVMQALEAKRLFILDYHDLFMPFINAVNELEGRKSYATRTIFLLTKDGILKPLVIELSLPPKTKGAFGRKRVFTPNLEPTNYWLWQLAKAHVCSNDAGHHQLVGHWLRAHACSEPYVISTHRQLSSLHPVAKLLRPHLRYTLEINGAARQNLIAADGVIESSIHTSNADPVTKLMFQLIGTLSLESCFTPGRYCMEMSSAVYREGWRFDKEGLPTDLLRRGMAVEDSSAPHGLKLLIEDYPYAADGLLLWSAINDWVTEYVSIYYKTSQCILKDFELQSWWTEIRTVGHADKKDEAWWPRLERKEDLILILTTIVWITSGHHAAVNFGQFAYSGYIPNHPCLTRRLIPEEGDIEYAEFLRDPQHFFLSMLPNQEQATVMMMIIEALSAHSPDEEYLGQRTPKWTADEAALNAFQDFSLSMRRVEAEIESRNRNLKFKNRNGAGIPPYELLFPRSGAGITGRGVPNSISI